MKIFALANPVSRMRQRFDAFRRFVNTDTGAVTIDWTALAAAVVGLGLGAAMLVGDGSRSLGDSVEVALASASVADLGPATTPWTYQFRGNPDWMPFWPPLPEQSTQAIVDLYLANLGQLQWGLANQHPLVPSALDMLAHISAELSARGAALPPGVPTLQQLDAQARAAGW